MLDNTPTFTQGHKGLDVNGGCRGKAEGLLPLQLHSGPSFMGKASLEEAVSTIKLAVCLKNSLIL